MKGQYSGVAARILEMAPKAVYIHCHSHLLCRPPLYEGAAYCVALCLCVCLSVRPVIVTERHVAPPSELQWHTCNFRHALRASVLFGTHWGPHIVRPSRPHKFLFLTHAQFEQFNKSRTNFQEIFRVNSYSAIKTYVNPRHPVLGIESYLDHIPDTEYESIRIIVLEVSCIALVGCMRHTERSSLFPFIIAWLLQLNTAKRRIYYSTIHNASHRMLPKETSAVFSCRRNCSTGALPCIFNYYTTWPVAAVKITRQLQRVQFPATSTP